MRQEDNTNLIMAILRELFKGEINIDEATRAILKLI